MYFQNENHHAVTKNDLKLLQQVCVALRTFCFIAGTKLKTNEKWRIRRLECHSVSRLISLLFKELILVDGVLVGLKLAPEENKVVVVQTCHSWLYTPDGAIIDPYPMGVIATTSALLIPTSKTKYCVHGGNLYHEKPSIREQFDVAQSWRNARSYLRTLKKNIERKDVEQISLSIF